MIVRISGEGQYELDDDSVRALDRLDDEITAAVHAGQDAEFHDALHRVITYIREHGKPVPDDQVVPSQVIVPPEDVSLEEGRQFFTDEGLMAPIAL